MFPSRIRSLRKARSSFRNAGLSAALLTLAAPVTAGEPSQARGPLWCAPECDQLISDWSLTAYQVITAADGYKNPLPTSRALAILHLAMHDAINAASPRYASYALKERDSTADPAVAGVQAAHDVLLALYPQQQEMLQGFLNRQLLEAGLGPEVAKGVSLGKRAAAAVLAARANDNSNGNEAYTPGTRPGAYRFVPNTNFVLMPHWRSVRPFALKSAAQFRVPPPPALTSVAYSLAFAEVKHSGGTRSEARKRDESYYAAFWYEHSDIGWNRIARTVARSQRQDLWSSARTFALLNVALADAFIAGWDSKMHHDAWRPVTAIRLAAEDGKAYTSADPTWTSFLQTPPVQDHPSTHSALGAAGAAALAHAFGRDEIRFSFASSSANPDSPRRSFTSFSQAARENADSRIKAGLHFRFATEAGLKLGHDVGRYATVSILRPLR
jgi:hypothetical protein